MIFKYSVILKDRKSKIVDQNKNVKLIFNADPQLIWVKNVLEISKYLYTIKCFIENEIYFFTQKLNSCKEQDECKNLFTLKIEFLNILGKIHFTE